MTQDVFEQRMYLTAIFEIYPVLDEKDVNISAMVVEYEKYFNNKHISAVFGLIIRLSEILSKLRITLLW